MSAKNVIDFLCTVAARADLLDSLKLRSKDEVIAAAAEFGFPFREADFDWLIWDLEAHLARKRGENFGPHFPLWETMWGKHYLDYLVIDMMTSIEDADIEAVIAARTDNETS